MRVRSKGWLGLLCAVGVFSILPQAHAEETLFPYADPGGKGMGYVNMKGEIIIPPFPGSRELFVGDVAKSTTVNPATSKAYSLIDRKGQTILEAERIEPIREPPSPGKSLLPPDAAFYFMKNKKWGIVSKTGQILVEPILISPYGPPYFSDGLMLVMGDFPSYYMNIQGEAVIPGPFEIANPFMGGFAMVTKGKGVANCGLINTNGEFVISPDYSRIDALGEGLIFLKLSIDGGHKIVGKSLFTRVVKTADVRKQLVVNYEGEVVPFPLPEGTSSIQPFINGYAMIAMKDGRKGVIDLTGKMILEPGKFFMLTLYPDKTIQAMVMVPTSDGSFPLRLGLMNLKGNWIIKPESLTYLEPFEDEFYVAGIGTPTRDPKTYQYSGWTKGLISRQGEWIVETIYDELHPVAGEAIMGITTDEQGNKKNVLFDKTGKILAVIEAESQ